MVGHLRVANGCEVLVGGAGWHFVPTTSLYVQGGLAPSKLWRKDHNTPRDMDKAHKAVVITKAMVQPWSWRTWSPRTGESH